MTQTISKPTPQERKDATAELRKEHETYFRAAGISDAKYIPKMAHYVKGLDGLQMGFFESEITGKGDLYTEKVSMQMESEDEARTLYRLRYNPHYEEEYAKSEPNTKGYFRYFVPLSEMEIVNAEDEVPIVEIPQDPNEGDIPMEKMTMRDHAAIQLRHPGSNKQWLNTMIKEANNGK